MRRGSARTPFAKAVQRLQRDFGCSHGWVFVATLACPFLVVTLDLISGLEYHELSAELINERSCDPCSAEPFPLAPQHSLLRGVYERPVRGQVPVSKAMLPTMLSKHTKRREPFKTESKQPMKLVLIYAEADAAWSIGTPKRCGYQRCFAEARSGVVAEEPSRAS